MDEEETQLQEYPEDKNQMFEETETGRPRREAAGRDIDIHDPIIGGK